MRSIFTFVLLLGFVACLYGQQPAQYSLYMFNKFHYNPAYAGLDNSLVLTGAFRKQWTGLEGSPTTQNLNAHLPVYYLNSGFGLKLENDVTGASKQLSIAGAFNYRFYVGDGILAVGLEGGIVQRSLDGNKLRAPEGSYDEPPGSIIHNDNVLPVGLVTAAVPTFSAGLYYQSERLEVGIAAQHLTEPEAAFDALSIQLIRNYSLMATYSFEIGRSFTLHPSLIVRSDTRQTQTDVSLVANYNENFFGGAGFRGYNSESIDAIAIIAGFKLSANLSLAYAYDLTLSNLNTVSNGSHEILITYNLNRVFGKGHPPRIIYNPRSL